MEIKKLIESYFTEFKPIEEKGNMPLKPEEFNCGFKKSKLVQLYSPIEQYKKINKNIFK